MLTLVTDTREQEALEFPPCEGVKHLKVALPVGDYGALLDGLPLPVCIERKSIADLFSSFSTGYDKEKAKIIRAKEMGWKYILAIEGTVTRVLQGHFYWNGTDEVWHPKSGLSQLRQLLTISIRYGVECWYCQSRSEMALRIQEYLLAWKRNEEKR